MDVADYPSHMLDVVVGVVGLVLFEYLDDLAARFVALGLAPAVLLAYLLGLVRLEPLLELLAALSTVFEMLVQRLRFRRVER